jgi:NDP-sugar pyrophosphorylase family protein
MGNTTISLGRADVLRVKDVQELRNLDVSVAKAYLDGELMSRHRNLAVRGGWVSEKASVSANAYVTRNAVVLGVSTIEDGVYVGNGATVLSSVVHSNASLGDHTVVRDSWVSKGTRTGYGVDIVSSTVLEGVRIGSQTSIVDSKVGEGAVLGKCVLMRNGQALRNVRIGDCTVMGNSTVFNNMEVGEHSVIMDSTIMGTRSGKIPACSTIDGERAYGDLEVGLGRTSNLIDPPEDCLPVAKYDIDGRLDKALGIRK